METLFSHIPLVDSNVLISFFIEDNDSASSRSILQNNVYLNDFVICETLNFLQNKVSAHMSRDVQESIFGDTSIFHRIDISDEVFEKARNIRLSYADNEWQFTDSILLAQSELLDLKLYTRDKKMLNYRRANVICP